MATAQRELLRRLSKRVLIDSLCVGLCGLSQTAIQLARLSADGLRIALIDLCQSRHGLEP